VLRVQSIRTLCKRLQATKVESALRVAYVARSLLSSPCLSSWVTHSFGLPPRLLPRFILLDQSPTLRRHSRRSRSRSHSSRRGRAHSRSRSHSRRRSRSRSPPRPPRKRCPFDSTRSSDHDRSSPRSDRSRDKKAKRSRTPSSDRSAKRQHVPSSTTILVLGAQGRAQIPRQPR
jgi:hypothetical protein